MLALILFSSCHCQGENPYKVDTKEITQRAKLLQRYIKDEEKELQALYALQGLMVQMEQPPSKCVRIRIRSQISVTSPLHQWYLSLCRFAADVLRRVLWRGRHKRGGFLQVGVQQRPRRAARKGRRPQIRHRLLYLAAWSWGRIRQQLGLWPHPLQRWIDVESKRKKNIKYIWGLKKNKQKKKHLGDFQKFFFFVFLFAQEKCRWTETK